MKVSVRFYWNKSSCSTFADTFTPLSSIFQVNISLPRVQKSTILKVSKEKETRPKSIPHPQLNTRSIVFFVQIL